MLAAYSVMKRVGAKMLVIAPKSVALHTWPNEVRKFDQFRGLKLVVLHGSGREERAYEDADVYVINPDGMPWLSARGGVGPKKRWPSVLCVDESTKYKHTQSERFKTLRPLLDHFERRYILTGEPMPNGLLDLFGQLFLLDGGQRLGKFITHYRNKYFYSSGFGGYKWSPLPGARDQILEKISDITLRLDKYDHLDLKKPLVRDIEIDLPHEVFDDYAELEREFAIELRGGEVNAVNAAALTAKLRQFASGAVYTTNRYGEPTHQWQKLHDAKLDALDALLAEREGKGTLVAYQFDHTAERIQDAYPEARLWSRLTPKGQAETLDAWNRGQLPLLVVHPASAAHGLNLQAGSEAIVWFDLTYDLEHYNQTIARLHRRGQAKRVVVHRIVARHTVDEQIVRVLAGKDGEQISFLKALKERFLVESPRTKRKPKKK